MSTLTTDFKLHPEFTFASAIKTEHYIGPHYCLIKPVFQLHLFKGSFAPMTSLGFRAATAEVYSGPIFQHRYWQVFLSPPS